ncbi:hypothetical protein HK405_000504, partial [Cladochytrium tenue]
PGQFFRVCVPGVSGAQYHALCAANATDASLTFVFGVGRSSTSGGSEWAARTAEHIAGRVAAGEPAWVRLQGPFGDGSRLAATSTGDGGELGCLVAYVGGSGVAMGLAVLRAVMERRAAAFAASTAAAVTAAAAVRGADGDVVVLTLPEMEAGWEAAATAATAMTATGEEGRVRVLRSCGRPYLRALLNRHVLESATRERAAASRTQRPAAAVGLFVCGPERFLEDAVESAAAFEGDHGLRVDLDTVSYSL